MQHVPSVSDQPSRLAPFRRSEALAISPYFVARVAGVPRAHVDALRFERTTALMDRLFELEEWLVRAQSRLTPRLYRAAQKAPDGARRLQLIQLKRDIFNLRMSPPEIRDAGLSALRGRHWRLLARWVSRLAQLKRFEIEARQAFECELVTKRELLAQTLASPMCQQAILSSNCDFFALLAQSQRGGGGAHRHSRRQGRIEITGMSYLARAAMRPTPLGHCTAIGWGMWSEGRVWKARFATQTQSNQVRLNQAVLDAITARLAANPEIRNSLYPQLNRTAKASADAIRWIATTPRGLNMHGVASSVIQSYSRVRRTEAIDHILRAIEASDRTYGDHATSLSAPLRGLLDRLIDLQLIEVRLAIPDLAPDSLRALEIELAKIPAPLAVSVGATLASIHTLLNQYASADPIQRVHVCNLIRQQLDDVGKLLSLDLTSVGRRIVYEDVAIHFSELQCPRSAVDKTRSELALWHELCSRFDQTTLQKFAARQVFEEIYSQDMRVPVAEFFQVYLRHFKHWLPVLLNDTSGTGDNRTWRMGGFAQGPYRSREIELIEAWQGTAVQWWRNLLSTAEEEVAIDEAELEALLSTAPETGQPRTSMALLCQIADVGGNGTVIIDHEMPGLGQTFSRFMSLFDIRYERSLFLDAIDSERQKVCPPGTILADLGGVFGFNGNLRPQQTAWLVDFPGTIPCTGTSRTIKINDLFVRLDREKHRLAFELGESRIPVWPVDLGTMTFSRQPPLYQFLAQTSPGGSFPAFPLGAASPTGEGVRRLPRVRLGQLIVQRARWVLGGTTVVASQGGDGFSYFLATRRWVRRHGLPTECWVSVTTQEETRNRIRDYLHRKIGRVLGASTSGNAPTLQEGFVMESSTPIYVDFANYFLVEAFRKATRRIRRQFLIEEVLPAGDDLFVESEGEKRVAQLCFEVAGCS
jgi:hypothetical protein